MLYFGTSAGWLVSVVYHDRVKGFACGLRIGHLLSCVMDLGIWRMWIADAVGLSFQQVFLCPVVLGQ